MLVIGLLSLGLLQFQYFVDGQLRCSNVDTAGTNTAGSYVTVDTPMTWAQARVHCQGLGADSDLIVVESEEENLQLLHTITGSYWIGASDQDIEGEYRRTNGEQDTESYPGWLWHKDEPSSDFHVLFDDDCGVFTRWSLAGQLNVHGLSDDVCFVLKCFICENDNDPCNATQFYTADSCDLSDRYLVYDMIPSPWMGARDICHADGRELVSLNTEDEVRYIRNGLITSGFIDDFWVGLNDRNLEGTWEWTGHPEYGAVTDNVDSGRWNPYEPNGGTSENCVEIQVNNAGEGRYNDLPCNVMRPFVCETSASSDACVQGLFSVYRRHRLLNHVMYTIDATSISHCAQACLKEPACLSINLIATDKQTTVPWYCELNSSNKEDSPSTDYVSAPGIRYADF